MAKKIKLTRPELKRQRETLKRFNRYLPMLKLKQQQLQMAMRDLKKARAAAQGELDQARARVAPYRHVTADRAGVDVTALSTPSEVVTTRANVAGLDLPRYERCEFPTPRYSLFGTPAWVDRTVVDLKGLSEHQAKVDVLDEQHRLLQRELTKIVQRVNLFEKVKIPEAKEAIRVIRIKLGDEMTAGVGRAKIAKSKITGAA